MYTVIIHQFDFPCVLKRDLGSLWVFKLICIIFQYTIQGNIQICGDYMHVARASDISCKKKQNFVGFLGANSGKNRPISRVFHGKID